MPHLSIGVGKPDVFDDMPVFKPPLDLETVSIALYRFGWHQTPEDVVAVQIIYDQDSPATKRRSKRLGSHMMVAVIIEIPKGRKEVKGVIKVVDVKRETHIVDIEMQVTAFIELGFFDAQMAEV